MLKVLDFWFLGTGNTLIVGRAMAIGPSAPGTSGCR